MDKEEKARENTINELSYRFYSVANITVGLPVCIMAHIPDKNNEIIRTQAIPLFNLHEEAEDYIKRALPEGYEYQVIPFALEKSTWDETGEKWIKAKNAPKNHKPDID